MKYHKNADVLIIGSGIAGLSLALRLSKDRKIVLITKGGVNECSTSWAQGGIASVTSKTDSYDKHLIDTIDNGHEIVDQQVASRIIKDGPNCIKWLDEMGIPFTKNKNGAISLTLEAAHSERRIIHIDDKTGSVIHKKLYEHLVKRKNVKVLFEHQIIDIISENNKPNESRCVGAYVLNKKTNTIESFSAQNIVLATGGASKIYQFTTNPYTSTGDGIAVSWRAGCKIANMEFIQFHPTCLYHPNIKSFLISESLRGEGGKLYTPDKKRFMSKYDQRGELASRDIVARAIDNEMKQYGFSNVFLDISHKSSDFIKQRFPKIYNKCLSVDIDITKEWIPVIPASHYTCGGVQTDISGKTNMKNLYVIGESSHTGFHGANRLASNSLLECLVMAKNCSEKIEKSKLNHKYPYVDLPVWDDSLVTESKERFAISHNWDELRKIMWNYVGIVRSDKRLKIAKEKVLLIEKEMNDYYYKYNITSDMLELRNIINVAKLIIDSALNRKESRGLHYSIDYPKKDIAYKKNTYIHGRKNEYHLKLVKFKV